MSEDEICTFDKNFTTSPALVLSGRDRIITYKRSISLPTTTTATNWCTIPLEVPQSYATQNDGKVHEWAFRIHSVGDSIGNENNNNNENEMIIGVLPCAVIAPPVASSSTSSSSSSSNPTLEEERIRNLFSPSGGRFFISQPNVNMSKVLLRYFDIADLICQFPRKTILAAISSVFNHSDKTVSKWKHFLLQKQQEDQESNEQEKISDEELASFRRITSIQEVSPEIATKVINFDIELKSRLHELFKFDQTELLRFLLTSGGFFQGDGEFRSFMIQYLNRTERLFNNNNNVDEQQQLFLFYIRAHRFASKNHPEQLRNSAALESWATSFKNGKRAHELSGIVVVSSDEQNNKNGNSTEEPIWRSEEIQTVLEAIFDNETTPLDFGVGITRNGVVRGSAKILSPPARRVSFTAGDTVFLTLDHKAGRLSIRVGDRLVVVDIELAFDSPADVDGMSNNNRATSTCSSSSALPDATTPTLTPAVSLSTFGQSIEIASHYHIPRNAVHRLPWSARPGSVCEDPSMHRPASSLLNSINVHPDSCIGSNTPGAEAPWRVRPFSSHELDAGNIERLAHRSRSVLPTSVLGSDDDKRKLLTATNLFDVMLDSEVAGNPYSFTSPLNQHQRCPGNDPSLIRHSNLLRQDSAKKAVDMITAACAERNNMHKDSNETGNKIEKYSTTSINNTQGDNNHVLIESPRRTIYNETTTARLRITSTSSSRPREIESETKFLDVNFPPVRRSINLQVATKDIDQVHGAPINANSSINGMNSIIAWNRISDFAKAESIVDENSSCSPMKKLPIIHYPSLVVESVTDSSSPRDVVRQHYQDSNNNINNATVVSEIASAALVPGFHKKIFYPSEYNPAGVYCVSLFDPTTSQWFGVIIDDFLPMTDEFDGVENIRRPRFVYSARRNEYWPSLLLKAFAKFYGSYQSLWDGNIPFFASPALLLRGGCTRRYTPSSVDDYFRALSFYADRSQSGDAVFACTGARDAITGNDQAVAEVDRTFNGASYLVLRTVPVSDKLKMVELLSSSPSQVWFGSWSPESSAWSKYPEVAQACDFEERGASLPPALQRLRKTCSFWVTVEEMAVYFKTLKCVSNFGDHFDPFDSQALNINTKETEAEHHESVFREVPRGPANNSQELVSSVLYRHPYGRVPALPDSLTVTCQRVQMQYLSMRESERAEEIPFILGLTGGFFPATCPQYILKITEPNTTISLLCDFIFQNYLTTSEFQNNQNNQNSSSSRQQVWRKSDSSKEVPSPLVSLYFFPDDQKNFLSGGGTSTTTPTSSTSTSPMTIVNRAYTISARNKRIVLPQSIFEQTTIKDTFNPADGVYQARPVPVLSWRSGGWSEPVTLQKCGQYLIVVDLPRDGGSSALELSVLASTRLPPIERLPEVPHRFAIGEIEPSSSTSSKTNKMEMIGKITSSGTGDDRIVVEVDAEDFVSSTSFNNKNMRLQMSVRLNNVDGAQQVVVQGDEYYTTRLSAVCPLRSEKEVFVIVEIVDTSNGDVVNLPNQSVKAELRVTSVLGKRHAVEIL